MSLSLDAVVTLATALLAVGASALGWLMVTLHKLSNDLLVGLHRLQMSLQMLEVRVAAIEKEEE